MLNLLMKFTGANSKKTRRIIPNLSCHRRENRLSRLFSCWQPRTCNAPDKYKTKMFRPRRGMPVRRRGGQGLGLFLLMAQIMQVGLNHIPPTTLAAIGLNVAIYLKVLNPFFKNFLRPATIKNICVSTYHVWYKGDWVRLFLAGWFHLDEWHLYYNMSSFLWKGRGLEGAFGTTYFAYLILVFSVLTNVVMVGVNIAAAELLNDPSYVATCAAGFSGVIFAMKVLTTYYTPAHMQRIFGFPVPSAWACWIELVLIQLLVPNASFTGHLAGILVGLAYVKGPLKTVMDIVFTRDVYAQTGASYTYTAGTAHGVRRSANRPTGQRSRGNSDMPSRSPSYTYTANTSGGATRDRRDEAEAEAEVSHGYQANDFTGGMSEQEQLEAAIRESMRTGESSTNASALPQVHSNSSYNASPSLPPHPNSNQPSTSSRGASTSQPVTQPPSYPDVDPMPQRTAYNGIDQDELRRRRLARFDS